MNKSRSELALRLKELELYTPTGDPHSKQMKEIAVKTNYVLLEIIETLEKIDTSNKKLEKSNYLLSRRTFWLQLISVIISVAAILIALFNGGSSNG